MLNNKKLISIFLLACITSGIANAKYCVRNLAEASLNRCSRAANVDDCNDSNNDVLSSTRGAYQCRFITSRLSKSFVFNYCTAIPTGKNKAEECAALSEDKCATVSYCKLNDYQDLFPLWGDYVHPR